MYESHLPCAAPSMSFSVSTTLAFPFPFPFCFGTGGGEPVVRTGNEGSWSLNQGWSLILFSFACWMCSQGGHFQDFWRDSGLTINASAVIRWIGMANPTGKSVTTNFTFCYWNIREICKYIPKLTSSSHTTCVVLFQYSGLLCCFRLLVYCVITFAAFAMTPSAWSSPVRMGEGSVACCWDMFEIYWLWVDQIQWEQMWWSRWRRKVPVLALYPLNMIT